MVDFLVMKAFFQTQLARVDRIPAVLLVVLTISFGLALATGCRPQSQGYPDRHARIFDSDVLGALLSEAPETLVNLDEFEPETWVPDMELGQPRDSLILAGMFFFTFGQDSLYFGNYDAAIYASDLSGTLHRQIGRRGKGPGEFDQLNDLEFNGTYFFLDEASRIQVLDNRFSYVATMPPQEAPMLPGTGLSVTPTYVYTGCAWGAPYRVCPRSALPPFEEVAPFLPSLGITDLPMDGVTFGATSNGRYVFVSFGGLPYVFVYDADHAHSHTIRLIGDPVDDHASNYTMSRPSVPGTGLRIFISRLRVLNDEYLAIPIRNIWHFIRVAQDRNGAFEPIASARLMRSSSADAEDVFATGEARLHNGYLYVYSSGSPHLLRYPFPY